jgi:Xaa-Pro aminopeptidase
MYNNFEQTSRSIVSTEQKTKRFDAFNRFQSVKSVSAPLALSGLTMPSDKRLRRSSHRGLSISAITATTVAFILLAGWISATTLQAQSVQPHILDLRNQARVLDEWAVYRLDNLVQPLMRREQIDMWVLVAREYNEDPVLLTMLPATWQSSRRTTILVFFDPGEDQPLERFAVSRYDIGFFETQWFVDQEPDQWKRFGELVAQRNPNRIGVNISRNHSQADGIAHTDYQLLAGSLSTELRSRIVSAENLAIGWLETRTPQEMTAYRHVNRIAHSIIDEGLSEAVITPGITTTEDLQWWFRERIAALNLIAWFHPSVQVIRREQSEHDGDFSGAYARNVIQPGDIIHMDLGITYMRLSTDTQRNAYVLRPGETEPPAGLQQALRIGNRLQDILTSEFRTGRTGNEILASALATARAEGINASIYTHPIGYHGHAAGTTIGLWDAQGGVPGAGDYPLYPNTAHAIELNAEVFIPEWNRNIRIMLEEDALFDGETVHYIDGRRTSFYLIPRVK